MDILVSAKAALLQALVRGEGYGLDLIERVKSKSQGQIVLGNGSVYPALRELERDGLVESYEGETAPDRGGRPRRYYRLTALGAKAATEQGAAVRGLFDLLPDAVKRMLGLAPGGDVMARPKQVVAPDPDDSRLLQIVRITQDEVVCWYFPRGSFKLSPRSKRWALVLPRNRLDAYDVVAAHRMEFVFRGGQIDSLLDHAGLAIEETRRGPKLWSMVGWESQPTLTHRNHVAHSDRNSEAATPSLLRRANLVFEFVSLILPKQMASEEIGDAGEEIAALVKACRPGWHVRLRVMALVFWTLVHAVHFVLRPPPMSGKRRAR